MVKIGNIRDTKKYKEECDLVGVIVRSPKKLRSGLISENVKHVPLLSPSWDLFNIYLEMKKSGQWTVDSFKGIYVPRFLDEMRKPEPLQLLHRVASYGKTHDIALLCFCLDEKECHRSIVAGILANLGVPVDCDPTYLEYSIY